jgi:hypothetical protein
MEKTLVECIDAIVTGPPSRPLMTPMERDAYEKEQTAARRPKVEACHAAYAKRNWNASSFAVGAAPSWHSTSGESGDLTFAGAAFYTSLALRLGGSGTGEQRGRAFGQAIIQARYRNQELVPSKTMKGTFFEQDTAGVGARLLLGVPERAVVVESEWVRKSPAGAEHLTAFTLSGGGQIKLSNDLWLSVAVGGSLGGAKSDEQRGGFVLSSFKWAFSREPAVKVP